MPPKAKAKLSKAEKEKVKREEAEKKAEEEEQARSAAFEEEKKVKEQEKVEASERKKIENEQKKVRTTQMLQLVDVLSINRTALMDKQEDQRKNAKWERYLRCDGSPDPTILWEINTYINLKIQQTDRNDAESILTDSKMDLALISELEFMIQDTPKEEITEKVLTTYNTTIERLQKLIRTKLDMATFKVLCNASKLIDIETNNLEYCNSNDDICICIWGNLDKTQKIKTYEFVTKGFTFEIPRILALTDCAVRVLFTKYDHCSSKSSAYFAKKKLKCDEVEVVEEVKEEEVIEEGEEKPAEENEGGEDEELQEEDTQLDLLAQLQSLGLDEEEKPEEEHKEEEAEEEEDDYQDPVTPEPVEWTEFDEEDDIVDLRASHVIGEVFSFDLVALPPQPKLVNDWTLTTLANPPELRYLEYQAEDALNQTKDQKDTQEKDKRDEKPPIGITLKLADDLVLLEEPQVAWWDADKNFWRIDGVSDLSFQEEKRTFSFKVSHFGTMALLQDAHINMPFQSWEIRPRAVNHVVLTIVAAIVELEIEIKDSLCCVSSVEDQPQLKHLLNVQMAPADLIRVLRKTGVNLFPAEDSSKYVKIQDKYLGVEDRLYEQMALVSSAMAFSWSKWNSEVDDQRKLIFQAAEHVVDERLLEEDWSLFEANKLQVRKLKMTEFDEPYSSEADTPEFYASIYHLAMGSGSEAAIDRIRSSSNGFVDCVQQLLTSTKVLTYA